MTTNITERKANTTISGMAKVAVQYFADNFVVDQTLVLLINICGENRKFRQAVNRYAQVEKTTSI